MLTAPVENSSNNMRIQLAGIGKSLAATERFDTTLSVTQTLQQRAIDDLGGACDLHRDINIKT